MASTIPLSRTISYASQFVRYSPLTLPANPTTGAAATNDPAYSNADWVRQFILSPPFAWRWNRVETTFTCIIGQTDYTVSLPNFGWIEKALIVDPNNGQQSNELEVKMNLAVETIANQPVNISVQLDDDSGDITFRLSPAPASTFVVTIISQNAAPTFNFGLSPFAQTFAPIPDYMMYIVNQGFLARCYEYANDPRYPQALGQFLQMLTGASENLSETQKSLFLTERMNTLRETEAVQQGKR